VMARLPGTTHPDEAVIYSAHWDHLGTDPKGKGDRIYNGAIDNATGVAAVLELAGRYAAQDPRPGRSVLFFMPTLEEWGLVGSRYYVAHPAVPLASTVADINFDVIVPSGPARNFVSVGHGTSELDEVLRPIVHARTRDLTGPGPRDHDHFLRSDHLSFAVAGVPVLYLRGGTEKSGITFGGGHDQLRWDSYGEHYHMPSDRYDPMWDLSGTIRDLEIAYDVGDALARGRAWPNYRAGTSFRAARDRSRGSDQP